MASRSLGQITLNLLLQMGGFTSGLNQAANQSAATMKQIAANTSKATSSIEKSLDSVRRNIRNAFIGVVSVQGIRSIIGIADEYQRLGNRLRLVTSSSEELAKVQDNLFQIAQRSRSEFGGLAELYSKLALTQKDLGATQSELLVFTEAVANALTVSGTSAQTARGALTQLAQGLAAGTFRAEEFNAVLEGSPQIIRVVAAHIERFGGDIGKLRLAVAAGTLGSQEFFRAFIEGAPELKKQIADLPVTVQGAFTQLQNAFQKVVGQADLSPLIKSIQDLAALVQDPGFQTGFIAFVNGIVRLSEVAVKAASGVGRVFKVISEDFKSATGQLTQLENVEIVIGRIQDHLSGDVDDIGFAFLSEKTLKDELVRLETLRKALIAATAPLGSEARTKALSRGENLQPLAITPALGKDKVSDADRARESILKQIQALEQQRAVIGLTTEAVIRYRVTQGDLAETLKESGLPLKEFQQRFVDLTLAIESGQADEKIKETIKGINAQIVALRAVRIEQKDGAAAALDYRLAYGDLAEMFQKAGKSAEEYRAVQAELRAEQATDEIEKVVTDLEEQIAAIRLLQLAQEQGAEAAIRYRIANGDLKQAFQDSGLALEEFVAEVTGLQQTLDGLNRAQEAQAVSEQFFPDAAKAANEYALAVEGLTERLKRNEFGLLGTEEAQKKFNEAVKAADKAYKEATKSAGDMMSVFRDEAMRATQDALAEFLFNPFEDGLKGMAQSFEEALRKIAANIVAARLAEKLFEGMEGAFDKFGSGIIDKIKGLFGGASSPVPALAAAAAPAAASAQTTAAAATTATAITTAGATTATALTTAGATSATALTTAGATSATAFTTSLATATAALTAAGTAVAAAITAAGAAAAASIASAAGAGSLSEIPLSDLLPLSRGGPIQHRAGGGIIRGPGTGTSDSIQTSLPAGGFVLREKIVRQKGVVEMLKKLGGSVARLGGGVPVRVSAGEWYVEPQIVRRPGMFRFLEALNKGKGLAQGGQVSLQAHRVVSGSLPVLRVPQAAVARPDWRALASGGTVSAFPSGGLVMPQAPAMSYAGSGPNLSNRWEQKQTVVNQYLTVNSPNGQVSRSTELQVTAAAARGARHADRRNN